MRLTRRMISAAAVVSLLCATAVNSVQAAGPVAKIIIGFPPGGNIDYAARLLGQHAGERLQKTFVIESKVGAGGALAAEVVSRAQPDGNTLLLASSANAILPAMSKHLRYDALNDFEWIGTFTRYPLVIAVPRDSPYKNFAELLNAARDNPGKISFGSAGLGTAPHLVGELVGHAAKVKFLHIPYKGEMPSLIDAVGGQVNFVVLTAPTVLSRLRSGDLRALAVSGDTRWRMSPATPTIAESGYPSFSMMSWVGLAAPKGTPPAEITRLNEAFRSAQLIPEIRQQVEGTGVDLYSLSPAETRELMLREVRQWRQQVQTAGISVD